jgi:succinate dehydrogenase/fumarate reductase flavoprotein subunit
VSADPAVETVDVVVVGSGTGLMAAVTAAELGLRVLVVEKSEYLGGSTAMSGGGFWIPGNSILGDLAIRDSRERVSAYLDALVGDTSPRARRESFLDHGPAAVEVLRRATPNRYVHMREYADYFPEVVGGSWIGRACESAPLDLALLGDDRAALRPTPVQSPVPMPITGGDYKWMNLITRRPRGARTVGKRALQGIGGMVAHREYSASGQALAAGLIIAARKAGVRLWTRAPLRDLVFDAGRATGVVVDHEGRTVTVRAERGVVLSSGGFEHNIELRHRYQSPELQAGWSLANPANVGEVLQIAEGHGVNLTLLDQAWWFPAVPPLEGGYPAVLLAERALPGSLIVDGSGQRFMNEAVNYMTAGQIMLGHDDGGAAHVPAWIVFDQRYRNRYAFGGGIMPRMPLPKAWYEAGHAYKAGSLEDLGLKLSMPALAGTVERFNIMAIQGHDDDFHRGESAYDRYYGDPTVTPNPNLGPLTKPPFYAVKVVPGDLGTCGGIQADELARAVDRNGDVIPGLYATGNAAGNAFGTFYPGPGATIGQGLTFGYIAAAHAAGRLDGARGRTALSGVAGRTA